MAGWGNVAGGTFIQNGQIGIGNQGYIVMICAMGVRTNFWNGWYDGHVSGLPLRSTTASPFWPRCYRLARLKEMSEVHSVREFCSVGKNYYRR